jgi:hypothetical protein
MKRPIFFKKPKRARMGEQKRPIGFITEKGSSYRITDKGTTIRTKSYHPEHGPDDVGIQPESFETMYVECEDRGNGLVKIIGAPKNTPGIGLYPLEIFYLGGEVKFSNRAFHIGNKIIGLVYE